MTVFRSIPSGLAATTIRQVSDCVPEDLNQVLLRMIDNHIALAMASSLAASPDPSVDPKQNDGCCRSWDFDPARFGVPMSQFLRLTFFIAVLMLAAGQ